MKNDIRITLALPPDTHDLLIRVSKEMDIDQGKVIRWGIKTAIELAKICQDREIKDKLSPHSKYMLDTLSSITS